MIGQNVFCDIRLADVNFVKLSLEVLKKRIHFSVYSAGFTEIVLC